MSTDGSDQNSPVEKLKRRLSFVPEVVKKHGPPIIGRGRANSGPPEFGKAQLEKQKLEQEQLLLLQKKREEKTAAAESAVRMLKQRFVKYSELGDRVNPQHQKDATAVELRLTNEKKIVDHNAAITALEQTTIDADGIKAKMNREIAEQVRRGYANEALTKAGTLTTAPKYGGKNPLKSTGEKEFRANVGKPVEEFLKAIGPSIKQDRPLDETQHARLLELKKSIVKERTSYEEKLEGIEKAKNPHEHKLIEDYSKLTKELIDELSSIESNNLSPDLRAHREQKRTLDAAIVQLDKTVELWKRIPGGGYADFKGVSKDLHTKRDDIYAGLGDTSTKQELATADGKSVTLVKEVNVATKEMFASKEACKSLDDAVLKMGSQAKTEEDRQFIVEAFKARFNVEKFDGDLTKTNVMAFYKTFKMVPDSHTKSNEWLTKVDREMSLDDVDSFYSAPDKNKAEKPKGQVAIRAMRTSGPVAMVQNNIVAPMMFGKLQGSKRLDQFTWVTLHEIGHAVDHSDGFMANGGNNKDFGDWKAHNISDIAAMMRRELQKEFPKSPAVFLAEYLKHAMTGKKLDDETKTTLLNRWKLQNTLAAAAPSKDALMNDPGILEAEAARQAFELAEWKDIPFDARKGDANLKLEFKNPAKMTAGYIVSRILDERVEMEKAIDQVLAERPTTPDPNSQPPYDDLAKAEIFKWYKCAKLVEPKGIFEGIKLMTGAACWIRSAKFPMGGRIYHEAYSGDWVSYAEAARGTALTDYQFRAPGEYFAESYAAYFMKKLPQGTVFTKLKAMEDKQQLAN